MELTRTFTELIDLRSFSNLWYWIALAVTWSSASHWVLGIPFDMVLRARRQGGETLVDLNDLARININRILSVTEEAGVVLLGALACALTMLGMLGFGYSVEFCQAIFLLALPLTLVGLLSVRTAKRIRGRAIEGADLIRALARHRIWVQLIGMVSIAVTAMWGMLQNFSLSPIG